MGQNRLDIRKILQPETELENKIVEDRDFRQGAIYGKPRKGHPEGEVVYHIREVLDNVERYCTPENRERLRLIALIHDTFKYKVDGYKPKTGENHHAMIARRFAEKYTTDIVVLEIIELHDEAYNAWQKGDRDNKWSQAESRANKLIARLDNIDSEAVDLYTIFYQCDNETGNKGQANLEWFKDIIL